jgi:signal transduction histidine kinase
MQKQLHTKNAQLHQEIAERKRVEEALREANISKDLFFSIIAHDLRSPFTALFGNAELAIHYLDTSSKEEMKECLTQIKTSAESVYALLENLLTWSRLQRGMMESQAGTVPLFETVDHIMHLFILNAQQKQITLRNVVPIEVSVYADANMIQTVIRNLLSNALKFTNPGGNIEVSAQQNNQEVEILISDTGMGISEDRIPNLFQVDIRSSTRGTDGEQGTGLGLPLCKDLVEKNGGILNVESRPGKGTTIRFTLPASPLTQKSPLTSKIPGPDLEGLARAIDALPKAWQTELQYAVEALNLTTANTLIDQIRQQDVVLADALGELVKDYRFDMLQALFIDD